MQIEIKRWDSGAVIHAGNFPDLCAAVKLTCEWIEAWLAGHGPKVEAP